MQLPHFSSLMRIFLLWSFLLFGLLKVTAQPIANFQTLDTIGCIPHSVQFTSTSQGATSWYWDLGNGSVSYSEDPSAIYTTAGQYTISLVVTDANGATDSVAYTNLINVVPTPIADFGFTVMSNCENGNAISFVNNSQFASSYLWDFDDGNFSSDPNPTHSYNSAGTYQVTLIATNSLGCTDVFTTTSTITIFPTPDISFTVDTQHACDVNHVFSFTAISASGQSFWWDFGDGTTANVANPSHQYSSAGVYPISVVATSSSGCSDTLVATSFISISPPVQPQFTVDVDTGCIPQTVQFSSTTSAGASAVWDFGDNSTGSGLQTSHQYTTPGVYDITLDIVDTLGCTGTTTIAQQITIFNTPTAEFEPSDSVGCAPLTIDFTDASTNAVSYSWDFGDGATSTLQNPSHTYTAPGVFDVSLQVTNSDGCTDQVQFSAVEVLSTAPSFSVDIQAGCAPLSVNFTDGSTNAVQWTWIFGDGSTSIAQNPSHTYTTNGLFDVMLITKNSFGCMDTVEYQAFIDVFDPGLNYNAPSSIVGCAPFGVNFNGSTVGNQSWLWDFGDGTTSSIADTSHVYDTPGTYIVSLTTYTYNGCLTTIDSFATVVVNGSNGSMWVGPIDCNTFAVEFDDTLGTATSWIWDFGDGDTSSLQNPVHFYTAPGIYIVQLTTIVSGCATVNSMSTFIDFSWCSNGQNGIPADGSGTGGSPLPDTVQAIDPITGCIPFANQFVNPYVGFPGVLWHFGDGGTSTLHNPVHVYNSPGLYDVLLILTDSLGVTDTIFFPDYVEVNGIVPSMIYTSTFTCDSMTVAFDESNLGITGWDWLFSDGTTDTISDPTHTFALSNSAYTAILTVHDTTGCPITAASTLFTPLILPAFTYEDTVCIHDSIMISSGLPPSYTYYWEFGDGGTSTQIEPYHAYDTTGSYQVTLEVTDTAGCVRNYNLNSVIYAEGPHADFVVVGPNEGCVDFQASFEALFANADSYQWEVAPGVPKTGISPNHTYNNVGIYDVTLQVENNGCIATNTQPQLIQTFAGTADFSMLQSSDCFPMNVNFTDLSTAPISWAWEFGDGATSNQQNPTHNYLTQPTGSIKLTIVDTNGCQATKVEPSLNTLEANFGTDLNTGCVPVNVTFSDSSNNAVTWFWDFGDGTTSTLQNPTHSYTSLGLYDVTLIVTSSWGCVDTMVQTGLIDAIEPIAAFTEQQIGTTCAPMVVDFSDQSISATSWYWDFGDGSTSTLQNPVHVYNVPGTYTVSLVASNSMGCHDTIVKVNHIVVEGPIADFTMTDTIGCAGLSVQFTNVSSNVSLWQWDFGDGVSSNDSTPTHVYDNPGSYTISLIVTDSNGCIDYNTVSNIITVEEPPTANFSLSDTVGCPGFTFNLTDSMFNASTWTWDLGDTVIQNASPLSYSYAQTGSYDVYLTVQDQWGCADTSAVQSVHILAAFDASIVPVAALCETDSGIVLTSIDSGGIWSGVGVTDSIVGMFDPIAAGTGVHNVIYSMAGFCGDADTLSINVEAPVNATIDPIAAMCANAGAIQLTAADSGGIWYGAGITDSVAGMFDPSVTGPGMYTISYAIGGVCADSATTDIKVNPLPVADARIDITSGCAPLVVSLTNQSVTQGAGGYWWYLNGALVATNTDTTLTLGSGVYDVALVIENQFGCTDSLSLVDHIVVNDTIPPAIPEIKRVSVLSDTEVLLEWQAISAADFQHYAIYRQDPTTGMFQLHTTIPLATTTSFIDVGVNTLDNVYCYKIMAVDSCGFSVSLDDLTAHCTMNVEAQLAGSDVLVSWTPYIGCNVVSYEIYRLRPAALIPEFIGTTDQNTTEFLDTTAYCPLTYSYRIKATGLCGTPLHSMSDTAAQATPGTLNLQHPTISRTTVVNDEAVLTEWAPPTVGQSEVIGYRLYKASDGNNFQFIGYVDSSEVSYLDHDVSVHSKSYTYKIEVVNTCEVTGIDSNIGTSILLTKTKLNDFQTKLNWTPYEEWDSGVEYYEIQRLNDAGEWEVIKVVDGTEIQTVIEH